MKGKINLKEKTAYAVGFKNTEKEIIKLLKPKDELDEFIVWTTNDITMELGRPNRHQSYIFHILECTVTKGLVEKSRNEKYSNRYYWQLKKELKQKHEVKSE